MVPIGTSSKDLKSVHYALALAARLQAHVYILQLAGLDNHDNRFAAWLDEALLDLINTARQAGLSVSHHITDQDLKGEIVGLVKSEGIDLLVFGTDDGAEEQLLRQLKPLVPSQIIQVREKDHISYL
jgi:hypothetical protein